MNQNQSVFVVDAGNTFLKVALFCENELQKVERFTFDSIDRLQLWIAKLDQPAVFVSSVLSDSDNVRLMESLPNARLLTRTSLFPLELNYETPETLGLDRICNAVAGLKLTENKPVLVIDLGTCIKFDFVSKEGIYQGGSISPGIGLRYEAMHKFTGKLPLICDRNNSNLIGKNTKDAMRSGVMNGIQAEINQFISTYEQQYQDLTFFVTGGDAQYFDFVAKNDIFVDENLTLKGLYHIFLFNAK